MQELSRNTVECLIFARLIRLAKIKLARYNNPCIGTYNLDGTLPKFKHCERQTSPSPQLKCSNIKHSTVSAVHYMMLL